MLPSLPPPQTHDPVESKLLALFEADSRRDVIRLYEKIQECVQKQRCSLQQIERLLRKKSCWTHLIARKQKANYAPHLIFELEGTIKTYELFLSVQSAALAQQEILLESSSYEENFTKLKDTGFMKIRCDLPLSPPSKKTKEALPQMQPGAPVVKKAVPAKRRATISFSHLLHHLKVAF